MSDLIFSEILAGDHPSDLIGLYGFRVRIERYDWLVRNVVHMKRSDWLVRKLVRMERSDWLVRKVVSMEQSDWLVRILSPYITI